MRFFSFFLALWLLSACVSHEPLPNPPAHWAAAVDEQLNLYRVDDKLLRSEQLTPEAAPLLHHLGVKTIVNLRYFDRDDDSDAFAGQGFVLINQPLLSWHITPQEIARVLYTIRQRQSRGAVLVHCYHGADRTGLVVAMYQAVYQNRSPEDVRQEMLRGPYGFHAVWRNIENFITEENIRAVRHKLDELQK